MYRLDAPGVLVVVLEPASDDCPIGVEKLLGSLRFGKAGVNEQWYLYRRWQRGNAPLLHVGRLAGGIRRHHEAVAARTQTNVLFLRASREDRLILEPHAAEEQRRNACAPGGKIFSEGGVALWWQMTRDGIDLNKETG